jgi:hypothetical protein
MPTIQDLFKNQNTTLYGKSNKVLIETRGIINPPRLAALLTSSPDALSDLIGNQIGGALGGSANRPTDTIFRKPKGFFTKPINLVAPTQALLRDSVKEGVPYFVKHTPAPNSMLARILGGDNPLSAAKNLAQGALNQFGSKSGVNALKNLVKRNNEAESSYGSQFQKVTLDGKSYLAKDVIFSEYYETTGVKDGQAPTYKQGTDGSIRVNKALEKRVGDKLKSWDTANQEINEKQSYKDLTEFENTVKSYRFQNQIIIAFKKYGTSEIIPFVGSATGISEDVTPEWSNYKYVGSPFKVYRYQGVERSLKFNLKLYYRTINERTAVIKKMNYLKSLAFPYETIAEMTYGGNKQTAQYAFTPNIFNFWLGDMYKNVTGHLESIAINVEDNVPWVNFDPDGSDTSGAKASLYPSVIDASLSIKIYETHEVDSATKTYKYNFDGLGENVIKTTLDTNKDKPKEIPTDTLKALQARTKPITI